MDNLAYLHLAYAYENCTPDELVSLSSLLGKATAPNWKNLSSRAWKYMLPVALSVFLFSAVGSAFALQKGDQGPSVKNLQQQLKKAGFYQSNITQVYDAQTENAVRNFQKAADLQTNGIAGPTTMQKLQAWRAPAINSTTKNTSTTVAYTTKTTLDTPTVNKTSNPNILQKGDEGENVRQLQEKLRVAGFYYGSSTGIFGPITEDAVKRFQTAYNLQSDGVVGPATERKLPPSGVGYGVETPQKTAVKQDTLRLGDRGEAVRVLQAELIKAGYLQGEPNGYYGPNTYDAVRRFQADNYLAASGIAGPTTRAKLYKIADNNVPNSDFDVLEIQRRLQQKGFYKGPLNGVLGDDTKQAIRQAQEFYGISLNDVKGGRY